MEVSGVWVLQLAGVRDRWHARGQGQKPHCYWRFTWGAATRPQGRRGTPSSLRRGGSTLAHMNPLETLLRESLAEDDPYFWDRTADQWLVLELEDAWRAAQDEAVRAYDYWMVTPDDE